MAACRPLDTEELKRMIAATGREFHGLRDRTLIITGCATGFRISELLSLCRQDVLDAAGRIKPVVTVRRARMKKKLAARSVPLPESVRGTLREWLLEQERAGLVLKSDPLFPSRAAMPQGKGRASAAGPMSRTAAWKAMRRLAVRAGVQRSNVGTHSMRKSFAGAVHEHWLDRLAAGERVDPVVMTRDALGHKQIQSTVSYLKSVTTAERTASFGAAARAVEAAIFDG